jgi:hypothetical protein
MSYAHPGELVGIFTERDLLKWIDEIQHGGHWEKPVAHLMSRPVKTLPMDQLEQAAEIMLEGHFRHLPVTSSESSKAVIGIVSMRDLLANAVRQKKKSRSSTKKVQSPLLWLTSNHANEDLRSVLSLGGKLEVVRAEFSADLRPENLPETSLFLLDLDGVSPAIWANFLKSLNQAPRHRPALVFFDPHQHDPTHVEVLQKLSIPGKIEAFAKPLQLIRFLDRLRELSQS